MALPDIYLSISTYLYTPIYIYISIYICTHIYILSIICKIIYISIYTYMIYIYICLACLYSRLRAALVAQPVREARGHRGRLNGAAELPHAAVQQHHHVHRA